MDHPAPGSFPDINFMQPGWLGNAFLKYGARERGGREPRMSL
jgi:hypothetical protein